MCKINFCSLINSHMQEWIIDLSCRIGQVTFALLWSQSSVTRYKKNSKKPKKEEKKRKNNDTGVGEVWKAESVGEELVVPGL